jgi:hypothetical protein
VTASDESGAFVIGPRALNRFLGEFLQVCGVQAEFFEQALNSASAFLVVDDRHQSDLSVPRGDEYSGRGQKTDRG